MPCLLTPPRFLRLSLLLLRVERVPKPGGGRQPRGDPCGHVHPSSRAVFAQRLHSRRTGGIQCDQGTGKGSHPLRAPPQATAGACRACTLLHSRSLPCVNHCCFLLAHRVYRSGSRTWVTSARPWTSTATATARSRSSAAASSTSATHPHTCEHSYF